MVTFVWVMFVINLLATIINTNKLFGLSGEEAQTVDESGINVRAQYIISSIGTIGFAGWAAILLMLHYFN